MLEMPDAEWYWAHVLNAMWALTIADNWEKSGDVDVNDAVISSSETIGSFRSMVGVIFPVAWAEIPESFLVCDGTVYARGDYPALYDVLDSIFHIDSDNFAVPDLSGRVPLGESPDFALNAMDGQERHALTISEMPTHDHTDTGHFHALNGEFPGLALAPGELPVDVPGSGEFTALASANITSTGGDNSHNNMQPYTVVRFVIAAR